MPSKASTLDSTFVAQSHESPEARLRAIMRDAGSVVVALSGGVDSSVVARLAHEELGTKALAITGQSPSLAGEEYDDVKRFVLANSISHHTIETQEMNLAGYVQNAPSRCYFCKGELYGQLRAYADENGYTHVFDGTHLDDVDGHRPSLQAARESDVRSPLCEVGLRKDAVRALARELGLENADRPSAPCLSSRIAYGVEVTPQRLQRVELAEGALSEIGFAKLRVRLHGELARVEVPRREFSRAVEYADAIVAACKDAGFTWVTLDLAGLRSGSLLEIFSGDEAS